MQNPETPKAISRYRTIKQCYEEIKRADADSVITEYFIRRLCKQRQIAFIESGSKIYVNLDSLFGYLNGEPP